MPRHAEAEAERRAACAIAHALVEQDTEGYVVNQWGKSWVGATLNIISVRHEL